MDKGRNIEFDSSKKGRNDKIKYSQMKKAIKIMFDSKNV